MLVYRVERSFCTQRESLPGIAIEDGKAVRIWETSWNKEPRSPYGWSGTDNSEETWEFLDKHGILSGNFYHHGDNYNVPNRPTVNEDKLLEQNILRYYRIEHTFELSEDWAQGFYFGFESVDAVYAWFDDHADVELLKAKGYYIAVYEAPDFILGSCQLMFRRSLAEQVDFILLK